MMKSQDIIKDDDKFTQDDYFKGTTNPIIFRLFEITLPKATWFL
jgi:hypothetical protein